MNHEGGEKENLSCVYTLAFLCKSWWRKSPLVKTEFYLISLINLEKDDRLYCKNHLNTKVTNPQIPGAGGHEGKAFITYPLCTCVLRVKDLFAVDSLME